MNEQINRIMTLPGYRKSCNRAINEALFYGLPILIEKLFGESIPQEEIEELKRGNVGSKEEEMNALIVRLLRETVLNVTIKQVNPIVDVPRFGAYKHSLEFGQRAVRTGAYK